MNRKLSDFRIKKLHNIFFVEEKLNDDWHPIGIHGYMCYEGYNDYNLFKGSSKEEAEKFISSILEPEYIYFY